MLTTVSPNTPENPKISALSDSTVPIIPTTNSLPMNKRNDVTLLIAATLGNEKRKRIFVLNNFVNV